MTSKQRVVSAGRSWRRAPLPVKARDGSSEFRRHLEGWELGVLTVSLALLGALLAVPRPVAPDTLPVPDVDRLEQRRDEESLRTRAAQARAQPLPFAVRAVGEAFRNYGLAAGRDERTQAAFQLAELRRLAVRARAGHGDGPLLALMALQTELFLQTLGAWEATGSVSDELVELAGNLPDKARASGWLCGEHRLCLTRAERITLFRVRWTDLVGLRGQHPFSPSLNQWRSYYRFLLEHPERTPADNPREVALRQLEYLRGLEKRDPVYPVALARGVLFYQAGAYTASVEAFRAHLAQNPDGPWRLRVQNYLRAALSKAQELEAYD